jgi:hypothetical protein
MQKQIEKKSVNITKKTITNNNRIVFLAKAGISFLFKNYSYYNYNKNVLLILKKTKSLFFSLQKKFELVRIKSRIRLESLRRIKKTLDFFSFDFKYIHAKDFKILFNRLLSKIKVKFLTFFVFYSSLCTLLTFNLAVKKSNQFRLLFENAFIYNIVFNKLEELKRSVKLIDKTKPRFEIQRSLRLERRKFKRSIFLKTVKTFFIFHIKTVSNNIFCHVTTNKGVTVIKALTPSYFNFKVSKKDKKRYLNDMLKQYCELILKKRSLFLGKILAIKLSTGKEFRRKISSLVRRFLLRKIKLKNLHGIMYQVIPGKPFNGCRGIKLRRKKGFKVRKYKVV